MVDEGVVGSARAKIARLLTALDAAFVEREAHVRLTLLALAAGHHVVLLGPPGTAKSQLARAVSRSLAGAVYFEYLLTKFTHPDEIFGPVSIPGLKDEDYRRLTEGFLPRAHVAFLDEIFKANSAILNSLLTLVNERVFHHGRHRDAVPLQGLVGASNEPPDPEGGLGALYDRFLVRLAVPPVAQADAFLQVACGELPGFEPAAADALTLEELQAVRDAAAEVAIPAPLRGALLAIRAGLAEVGVAASDRRWRWALELLRVAAVTGGRAQLSAVDLVLLEHCLGDPPETDAVVRPVVRRALEGLVDFPTLADPLHHAWLALGDPDPDAGAFDAARQARLARLDAFEGQVEAAASGLDGMRDTLLEQARSSPWLAEVPARLLTGFVAARQRLQRFRDAAAEYRRRLEGFSFYDEVLPRAREAQLSSIGHRELMHWDEREPPLWVSRPGEPPDRWVPVSAEGLLLVEQRTAIAGELLRRHHARAYRTAPGPPSAPDAWHRHVVHAALDDATLFRLLERRSPQTVIGEVLGVEAPPDARRALRALVEWLKGTGLRDVPPPPALD